LSAFEGDIYWSDTVEDVIRKAKHNGSDPEDVVIDGLDNVEGIVVDSTGRKVDSCQSRKNIFLNKNKFLRYTGRMG
jgi:Low-density lipoprotein receptor repeat class B